MLNMVLRCLLVLFLGALGGCGSSPKDYANTLEKNVTVNVRLGDTANALFPLRAKINVSEVKADCTHDFLGRLQLDNGENKLGLAPGKSAVVALSIFRSDRYGSEAGLARSDISLVPLPGKQYEIDVSYVGSMINLSLYEQTKSGRKELSLSGIPSCKAGK